MAKFLFVSYSADEKFSVSDEELQKFLTANNNENRTVSFYRKSNNKEPITKVYNRFLEDERNESKFDFVVFYHSDVSLDFTHLMDRCEQLSDKYDIMGLCGTSKVVTHQTPFNWFTSSMKNPERRFGYVNHGELGNKVSFFNQDRPDIEDAPVACIDGLCIIFGKRAIESGLKFDEIFTFDFYDSDISFQALMNHNLRLGVIVEKSLKHYSVGRSILTKDFLTHEIDFRKKWNLDFPPNSPIKKMVDQNKS